MTDLFEHAADRQRDRLEIEDLRRRLMQSERENMELRIRLANALSAMRPLWNIQARSVRKAIREALAA